MSYSVEQLSVTSAIDSMSSSRISQNALYKITLTPASAIPKGDGTTGGLLEIVFPADYTVASTGCTAVSNNVYYTCVGNSATRTYQVYSKSWSIASATPLTIFVELNNPSTCNFFQVSYWYLTSLSLTAGVSPTSTIIYNDYSTKIVQQAAISTDYTNPTLDASKDNAYFVQIINLFSAVTTTIPDGDRRFLPFYVDYDVAASTTTQPIRFRFKVPAVFTAGDKIRIDLPSGEFTYDSGSTLLCWFKQGDGRFFTNTFASNCEYSGTTSTLVVTTASDLLAANLYELIIMTSSTSPINFAVLAAASSPNTVQVTWMNSAATTYYYTIRKTIYRYQAPAITWSSFYYTSKNFGADNTLVMTGDFPSLSGAFPNTIIEWSFETSYNGFTNALLTSAPSDKSQFGCGYSTTAFVTRGATYQSPFCTLIQGTSSKFTPTVVSMENFGTMGSTSAKFFFYDVTNPSVANNHLSISLRIWDLSANRYYYSRIWQPFIAENTAPLLSSPTLDYPTLTSYAYNAAPSPLTFPSIASWPAHPCSSGPTSNCKFVVSFDSSLYPTGSAADFQINGAAQTILERDSVNSKLCKLFIII